VDELVEAVRRALYSFKICAYAQGFQLMAAQKEYDWTLDFGTIPDLGFEPRYAVGAHTYERVDAPRGKFFHVDWPDPMRPQQPI
jgi:6-phosphogluconate dehydrogenase